MDVRQFAFFVRQPSAALKSRSTFLGLPKRGVALILANAMFWQPLLAQADGIVVSAPGTTLGQAGNGVPIVNIAAPNANGLSHNQFNDYNVGANGVILNNATDRTQSTQLGGIIVGNPNFRGTAANIILNEVNGGSPSQLRGYTEVAGQSAHVIVANPYGISCNGCGFINTPQATLTTGKAVIENGQISRYQVDQGTVAIEGAGLNASNIDQFEIITRATTINAQIQAKKLTIVAGRNDVDARTLNATTRVADGSQAPELAIDSSALGGMYVGAVKLIGTEAGVGVRLSGDMVAGGDIQIDTAGNVVMGQASAGTAIAVKAASVQTQGAVFAGSDLSVSTQGALTNSQTLAAKNSITLDAGGRLTNSGIIEAGVNADNSRNAQGDVRLTAQAIDNAGKTVIASRELTLNTGELTNQGGTLSAQRDAQLNTTRLDNQNQGRILSAGSLGINATQLLNSQGGLITSTGNLTAGIGQLINRQGELSSLAQVTLQLNALDNVAGLVSAGQSLSLNVTGQVNNQGGRMAARQSTQLSAASLDNRNGELVATDLVSVTGALDNSSGRIQGDRTLAITSDALTNTLGTVAAGNSLALTAASLDNTQGKLTSDGALTAMIAGQLLNQTGLFAANGDVRLDLGSLDNRQGNVVANNLDLLLDGPLNNQHGTLRAETRLGLKAGEVDNSAGGRISSGQTLTANVASLDQHNDGRLFGQGDVSLDLNGGHLNNSGGVINAPGRLLLSNLTGVDNTAGEISSSQAFSLAADSLNNAGAKLLSEQTLTVRIARALDNTQGLVSAKALDLRAASVDNQGGTLSAGDGLIAQIDEALDNRSGKVLARTATLNSASLDNRQGLLQSDTALNLTSLGVIDNRQGTSSAGQSLDISAASLDNGGGKLVSDGQLTARIAAQLLNQAGLFSAGTLLQVSAASLDNSAKGNLHAKDQLAVTLSGALNNDRGTLGSDASLNLKAGQVANSNGGRISSQLQLTASVSGLDQHNGGGLYSQSGVSLDLNHGHLNNQGGLIHAPGALLLSNLASVDNQGGEISSAQALDFTADSLDNRSGKLLSEQGLIVRIARALDNTKGLIASTGLDLQVDSLVNAEGELKVRDDVKVHVATELDNRLGKIVGATTALNSQTLDNSAGLLQGDGLLTVSNTGIAINRGGRVISGQRLDLSIGQLDNRGGVVSSVADLNFTGKQFDNSAGGRLLANGALNLTLEQLNNGQGTVRSDNALTLQATTLNNDSGRISSGAAQQLVTSGALSNRSGEMLSAMALTVSSANLDNSGGKLTGDGAVRVTTGALNNQSGGRLTSADRLDLTAGQVDNRFDGHIASNQTLTASVTGLDQRGGGQLYSLSDLSLDMNHGALNNAGGLIHAPGQLLLKNLSTVGNQNGEISSEHAFSVAAQSLDNSNGSLLSDQALSLKVDQALINIKGRISAADLSAQASRLDNTSGVFSSSRDLTLTLGADLLNDHGEVSSGGASVVNAMTLNNRNGGQVMGDVSLDLTTTGTLFNQGGTVGAGQRLSVTSASLDNSRSGSVVTDGDLTVKVDGVLDNRAQGAVLAKGVMAIDAGSVDNRAGRLSGQNLLTLRSASLDNRGGAVRANRDVNLQVGQLDNRAGVLNSKQALAITGQSLNNGNGLASAIGPVRLTVDTVDNAKGRIASQDDLNATLGVLNQQGGQLVAQGDLTLKAESVDNRDGGLLAATKALKLTIDTVDNRSGEISSQQATTLSGVHLDNSGGKLLAGTALELSMVEVINQAKGLVFAQDARFTGKRLDNTDGTVGAQHALAVQLAAGLDNTRGKLSSEGALELAGQRIDNTGGGISSAGPLTITSATDLLNNGGTIESAQALALTSASLDNSQGLLKSQGATTLNTGLFNNGVGGRAISADKLDLTAAQFNNAGHLASVGVLNANLTGLTQLGGAELVSSTQLNLDLHNGELVNAGLINASLLKLNNVASIDNSNGEISSQNAFALAAKNLTNNNGKLISNQALTLRVEQQLANVKGHINAASLDARSTRVDNTDGVLSGRGDVTLSASELIDNTRGSVIADGGLLLTGAALDNRTGEIAGKSQVSVNVDRLDNRNGKLISTDALQLRGATLDNRNGLAGATKALKIEMGSVDNRAGELTGNADVTVTGQLLNNSDKGVVFAGAALSLAVDQVINRTLGELNGQRLSLTGTSLDNTGGKLLSQQPLVLALAGDLDNSQGVLSSEDALEVKARSLNNSQGSLSSAKGLSVAVSGTLNNQEGKLMTDGGLTLGSASLGNQQGVISGKGPVVLTTGELNNQAGRLNSGDTLALTTAQLNNGGSIGSAKALTASVSGLDQRGGKLFSNAGLSLDLNNGQLNNQSGLINAAGPLLLNRLTTVANNNGEISSGQAFTLAAQSLDNSNGKLLSNQALIVRVDQALNNVKGLIGSASLDAHAAAVDNRGGTLTSRGDLRLTSDGLLSNGDRGLIGAAQVLDVHSADLNNQNGSLLGGAVTLNAIALDNTASGLINSQSTLNVAAASLNTGNGGEVSARSAMTLGVTALAVAGGRIIGEQGVSLDLNGSDLDNRNGLILANGPLALNNLRDLNNRNGEISSQQGFSLTAHSLDNSGGKLISSQTLGVNAVSLNNSAKGLLSGAQGLNVSGGNLDNRDHGTLVSRNGSIDVRLSGTLQNNTEGALVSQGRLDVSAAGVDNRGNGVLSSGAGQTLAVTGALVNGDGGLIESGDTLGVQAVTLANQGTINAQRAFTFTGTDLTNNGGSLLSNGQVTLDLLGNLNNSGGKIASVGPLLLQRANQVYNDADGKIISQSLLTLLAGGLDNSERGTIAAKERVVITTAGVVQNHTDGLIYSQDADVQLNAAGLNNAKGNVQGQTGLGLGINGDVDNRGGTLASLKGLLDARLTGGLNNGGGIIQAQGLNLIANRVDNQTGRIAAQTGDAVINASAFANANGGVYAKGLVRVAGQALDNSAGQIAGGVIDLSATGALTNRAGVIESDSTLSVVADSVDNGAGKLRALGGAGKTLFQIGNLFDNRSGVVETANTDLTLAANSFLNSDGRLLHVGDGNFDISLPNVTGAGGSIVTRGGLTLNADTWSNSSVIQAGRLNVNVNNFTQTETGQLLASTRLEGKGGNWTNNGLIASDGSMALQLTGTYQGNGKVSSVGALDMSAAQLTLTELASIAAGGATTINAAGQLTNRGRLTSNSALTVNAGDVTNFGTLASGQNLLINAQTLTNDRIRQNQGSLLLSGGDMKLQVGTLTNRYSDIYSLGGVEVGGYNGAERATRVDNLSGRIESTGDMSLKSAVVTNKMESFSVKTTNAVSANIGVRCFDCNSAGQNGVFSSHLVWQQNFNVESTGEQVVANIVSGKKLSVLGDKFENFNSAVSAVGDINIAVADFNNTASSLGSYQSLKYINMRPDVGLWSRIFAYNAANDPTYNRNIHFWNAAEQETIVGLKQPTDRNQTIATYKLNFGAKGGFGASVPKANFIPGVTVQAPAEILGATPFAEKIIAAAGATFLPATIQAGGNVSINATNKITNGVERSFVTTPTGAPRSTNTQAAGTGNTTVINLNRQLPPDLAQRKVDPLTLPGFSLPNGQNGLFRVSGQGTATQQTAQSGAGSQSWTMGGADVSLAQRQQALAESQGRTLQLDGATRVTTSTHQVSVASREAGGITADARAINASGTGSADTVTGLPGRTSGANITRLDGITAANQAGTPAVSGPELTGLNPSDRDPRSAVTTPAGTPTLVVPGVSTVDRNTRVSANQAGDFNLPGITPLAATTAGASGAVSGQTLNRVQGLPGSKAVSQPHKYLIETNPVLTDLKQFMSSDYLLAGLGYNPDDSAKRLGDGLYEQRLIQQAIVDRTGQRFIDGQTSDEAVFRYLMDNAIRSKQSLDLSVGVSLTGQQVAALTHDIVWLEEQVVNGEKVLVPVVYLAQADNRLAPDGALIVGQDVSLIAGKNLENAGTLRASNNLSAIAGNDLINSGLIEAGNRLDLLAGNNIVNKSGGIIAGRDVSLTAVNGNVVNERSMTRSGYDVGFSKQTDYIDSAARIEAANDLSLKAGRDVTSAGGVLHSGNDTTIVAGRDVNLVAAQQHDTMNGGKRNRAEEITQSGSDVEVGRDLKVSAGRDFTAIASDIEAKRDISMSAGGDLYLAAGADEQHSYSKTSSTKRQEDHVSQVGTNLTAGRDVALIAGKDLALIASRISAGDEAYLITGNNLGLLSAEDSDYSLYDMKRGGGIGSGKTQRDEITKVRNVGSEIKTGGDLVIQSSGDQKYQVAKLDSGDDLSIISGGSVTFEGKKDLHQESHEKSKSSFAWNSAKGQGNTDETLRQTQMVAKGDIVIKAVDGLHIDLKQVNQQTVTQAIDAMVAADPQMAWLKEAEKRGDVDWKLIKETHDSFKYSNSSLGQGAMLAIVIIVSVLSAGAASGAIGTMAGAQAGSGAALAASGSSAAVAAGTAASAGWANAALSVGLGSLASTGTVSLINNKGNLGAALGDTFSADSLKNAAVGGLTAGALRYADTTFLKPSTGAVDGGARIVNGVSQNPGYSEQMLTWQNAGDTVFRSGAHAVISSGISTALNGGNFGKNLGSALLGEGMDLAAAAGNRGIGDLADKLQISPGTAEKIFMHAILGGALAAARGGDFKTGAVAGAASEGLSSAATETLGKYLDDRFATDLQFRVAAAQAVGVMAGALVNGDPGTAAWVAGNTRRYNDEIHLSYPWAPSTVSLMTDVTNKGGSPDQVIDAVVAKNSGAGYDGWMPANALVQAWSMMVGFPVLAIEAPAVGVGGLVAGGVISGGANLSYQLRKGKPIDYVDLSIATGVGAATQGKGLGVTMGVSLSGSSLGSYIKGEDGTYALLGTAVGGLVGFKSAQWATGQLKPILGGAAETVGASAGGYLSEEFNGHITELGPKK